jgi:hypothetical protein
MFVCALSPQVQAQQKKLSVVSRSIRATYSGSLGFSKVRKADRYQDRGVQFQTSDYVQKYTLAFEAKRPRFDVVMMWDFFLPQLVAGTT